MIAVFDHEKETQVLVIKMWLQSFIIFSGGFSHTFRRPTM